MADFHAADLWVAVVPETSQVGPAMEAAGKEAKGKFGAAVKDFGKTIHDDLDKIGEKAKDSFSNAGIHAKDAFGKAGKMAGDAFNSELGKELQSAVGDEIGKAVSGAVKDLPLFKTATEYVGAFTRATDAASNSLGSVRDTLTSIKSHDVDGALGGVESSLRNMEPIAKQFGTDISDWHVPAPLTDGLKKADETSHDLVKNFADAKGGIDRLGQSGGGLSGLIGKLGELGTIAAAVVATLDTIKNADHWLEDKMPWYRNLDEQFKNNPLNKFFGGGSSPSGPSATTDANGQTLFRSGTVSGPQMPDNPTDEWDTRWGPRPAGGGLGWFGKGAPPSLAPTDMPDSPSGSDWDAVSQGESGGKWDTNTGNGFYGGLQFTQSSWEAAGGLVFAPRADMATPKQQKMVAERLFKMQGPGAWPHTYERLPGGGGGGNSGAGGGGGSTGADAASMPGSDFGAAAGNPTIGPPDENSIRQWVQQNFGIPNSFGTGSWENKTHGNDGGWHPKGYAFDFHGSSDQMAGLANWVANNHSKDTLELIYGGAGFDHNREIKNGKFGDVYGAGLNSEHRDHVHWAMTAPPWAGGRQSGSGGTTATGQMPTGAEHDPLYVTQASAGAGGSGSNSMQSNGQQLGQGLLSGLMQSVGLDGSVFGGKSPLDWGAVKLGGGLLNYGMGLAKSMGGMGGGPMGTPGLGSGGGGGLGGLAGLIPGPGAAISAAAGPGGGSLGIGQQSGGGPQNVHVDNRTIVSGNTVSNADELTRNMQWQKNAERSNAYLSNVPVPS